MSPAEPKKVAPASGSQRNQPSLLGSWWAYLRLLLARCRAWLLGRKPPADPPQRGNWLAALLILLLGLCAGWLVHDQDRCPNLTGFQFHVPAGLQIDRNGRCVPRIAPPPIDVCPDLPGIQTEVPAGMRIEPAQCVLIKPPDPPPPAKPVIPPTIDVCTNIEGAQSEVPMGMLTQDLGQCVCPPHEACPRQKECPVQQACPPPCDVCPNLPGSQFNVPPNMHIDERGHCVENKPAPDPLRAMQGQRLRDECMQSADDRRTCYLRCIKDDAAQRECIIRYGRIPSP